MSSNTRADGLLKTLQNMNEVDRGRIVEYLPPEEVRAAFLLVLREQDEASVPQSQPPVQAISTTPQFIPTDDPTTAPTKRRSSAASFNDSKRARTDAAEEQETVTTAAHMEVKEEQMPANAEVAGQQENDNSTAHILFKKEHEIIDLGSDDEEKEELMANYQRTIEDEQAPAKLPRKRKSIVDRRSNDVPRQRKPQTVRNPVDLPIYLRFRNEQGEYVLKTLDDLPVLVRAQLKRRYEFMCLSSKYRRDYYASCTLNPARYTDNPDRPCCIRTVLIGAMTPAGTVRQSFSQGGDFMDAADDRCVKAYEPCAHFANHNGEFVIRIVPLPSTFRAGKTWTDLGYWVL
ncbi:hypothetical protein J4E83_005717 [Alternaria metachromatica]|uniref:uncharacterized protein n=1 Tax=Alternaria metachromatica TaxID=283354 RepID=UPI0020C2262A|nr:uncharacterized protein J4E83_005717 [Alternaria metachromatica]KAI4619860.1 hypothetical protein J4E83_005717 [Alternaria metachromatica]